MVKVGFIPIVAISSFSVLTNKSDGCAFVITCADDALGLVSAFLCLLHFIVLLSSEALESGQIKLINKMVYALINLRVMW